MVRFAPPRGRVVCRGRRRSLRAECSEARLLNGESNSLGDTCTVLGVDLEEVREDALLDVTTALAEATRDVVHHLLAHGVVEDLAEEFAGLLVVGVGVLVGIAASRANQGLWSPLVAHALNGSARDGVWLVVGQGSVSTVDGHETITSVVVAHAGLVGAVDGDLVVVRSESVSVSVGVVHETALEHLVVGGFDAWDHVSGGKGGLLRLSVEVLWVLVEDELADLLERVIGMRPDLGDVIDIEAVLVGIGNWHDLGVPGPGWEVALLDVVEEVHGGIVLGCFAHLGGLLTSEALDALVRLVVVLDEELFVLGVDPLEGVRSVSVHVSVAVGGTAVGHQNGNLVESLRGVAPEIPGHVGVLHAGLWVSLLAVDEIGELDGVLDEEDWGVVADHIVVALLGVMLDGEAARVTVAIVGAALAGDGREAKEDGCALANGVHEGSLAESKSAQREIYRVRIFG